MRVCVSWWDEFRKIGYHMMGIVNIFIYSKTKVNSKHQFVLTSSKNIYINSLILALGYLVINSRAFAGLQPTISANYSARLVFLIYFATNI